MQAALMCHSCQVQSNLELIMHSLQKVYSMVTAGRGTSKGVTGSDTLNTLKYSSLQKYGNPA